MQIIPQLFVILFRNFLLFYSATLGFYPFSRTLHRRSIRGTTALILKFFLPKNLKILKSLVFFLLYLTFSALFLCKTCRLYGTSAQVSA